MSENEIEKLPVAEGLELQVILTRTDIATHYRDFIQVATQVDQRLDYWEARRWIIDDL